MESTNTNTKQIPKIIWALWLNFNGKTDGILDDNLTFFKNRIVELHKDSWEINIITSWTKLLELVKDNHIINQVLNNTIIGGAHKSDLIRFFLLNTYGGVWIDLTTFFVQSLDYLLQDPKIQFICFYAPVYDVVDWLIHPLNELFEYMPYSDRIKNWLPSDKHPVFKSQKFKFIPENYFICSTLGHPIISKTFKQLTEFWEQNIPQIDSQSNLCFILNTYIQNLSDKIFNINYDSFYSDIDKSINTIYKHNSTKEISKYKMAKLWECGYLFNYLQMYISIIDLFSNIKDINKDNEYVISYNKNTKLNGLNIKDTESICHDQNCEDITIKNSQTKILLLSASVNRLGKWSDNRGERINWTNTYLGKQIKLINNIADAKTFITFCKTNGFNQFKFSSYARQSYIITDLKKWFSNNVVSGFNNKNIITTKTKLKTKTKLRKTQKKTQKILKINKYKKLLKLTTKKYKQIHY